MRTAVPTALIQVSDNGDVAIFAVAAVLGLLMIVLWVSAAISIVRNSRLSGGGKFLWFVVIIGFPFLGSLGWFFFGRKARLVRTGATPPLAHA